MVGKKILIADDNPDMLTLLVTRLKHNNYDVIAFSEGREVIEKCRICNPDLIILDIVMQNVDGYTVAHALREDKDLVNIPIIFITAQELEYSLIQKKIAEIGYCDFITKFRPFEELLAKIREKIG